MVDALLVFHPLQGSYFFVSRSPHLDQSGCDTTITSLALLGFWGRAHIKTDKNLLVLLFFFALCSPLLGASSFAACVSHLSATSALRFGSAHRGFAIALSELFGSL